MRLTIPAIAALAVVSGTLTETLQAQRTALEIVDEVDQLLRGESLALYAWGADVEAAHYRVRRSDGSDAFVSLTEQVGDQDSSNEAARSGHKNQILLIKHPMRLRFLTS